MKAIFTSALWGQARSNFLLVAALALSAAPALAVPAVASASGAPSCESASNADTSAERPVGLPRGPHRDETGDATVVAIVDYEPFTPYHRDLYAQYMPQHLGTDPTDDLPLHCSPQDWLPGFTASSMTSFERLDLTLSDDPAARRADLTDADADEWAKVRSSGVLARGTATEQDQGIHGYWMPGTKVVAALTFGQQGLNFRSPERLRTPAGTLLDEGHGVGSTSVSVGNLHGTCPQCLLVFIQVDVAGIEPLNVSAPHDPDRMEQALEWAYAQPWIDVVSMPGTPSATPYTRDRIYGASRTELQSQASERGQTLFFSSGNGHDPSTSVAPSTTLQSSLQGPDWVMTVSGTDQTAERGTTASGYGKVVDVSGVASEYPSAYGSETVAGEGYFAKTSNAVAATSGLYAEGLYLARRAMSGPSRVSSDGIVARGTFACATDRLACELGDGVLTAQELRHRMLMGADHTATGVVPAITAGPVQEDRLRLSWEEEYAAEGHGTYLGRCRTKGGALPGQVNGFYCTTLPLADPDADTPGDQDDYGDVLAPFLDPLFGLAAGREELVFADGGRPPGEREWFVVDSYCRQLLWGPWSGGVFRDETSTPLPAAAADAPLRQAYREGCTLLPTPQHQPGDRTVG